MGVKNESDRRISLLREKLDPSTGRFFNDIDIMAARNAVPYLNLSTEQAKSILLVAEHEIAERAKQYYQREALLITAALVKKLGGEVRLTEKELEEQDFTTLKRWDDSAAKEIFFTID